MIRQRRMIPRATNPVPRSLDPSDSPLQPSPEDSAAEFADDSIDGSEDVFRDFVVPESADGLRIDLFLTQSCDGYSRTQIRQAVQEQGAQLDGRVVRPSIKIHAGQRIRFRLPPPPTDETIPENIPLDVLFEDDGLVVVNKPAGMVVHPARGNWTGTLTSASPIVFNRSRMSAVPPDRGSCIAWIGIPAG